jgi:AcrR family transcriptional regulator
LSGRRRTDSTNAARPDPGAAKRAQANTAGRIVAAARAILEKEGPQAVTMRRVAQELGITPMAIYHHYKDRQAVLQRIVDEEFERLGAIADRLGAAPRKGLSRAREDEDRLLGAVDAYLDYAFARPHMFDFIFNARRESALRYPRDFRARRSPTLTPVADEMERAMDEGRLARDDPWEIAVQFWAHAHGYVTLYRAGRFDLSEKAFRALYRRAVKRLLDGLRQ